MSLLASLLLWRLGVALKGRYYASNACLTSEVRRYPVLRSVMRETVWFEWWRLACFPTVTVVTVLPVNRP